MKKTKSFRILKRTLFFVLIFFITVSALLYFFLTSYTASTVSIQDYINMNPKVTVSENNRGILFDSKESQTMIIFYPGAKIESNAYIPLMMELAQNSIDGFIVKMPFNLAFFDPDAFNDIFDSYHDRYRYWYIMGHSLGGAMAANFAFNERDKIRGIILLAAYPTKNLKKTGIPLLSIYGDQDSVLNMKNYEENKGNWSEDSEEVIIRGGNHAGFGNYGNQKGDNKALISSTEQQYETSVAIEKFVFEHN